MSGLIDSRIAARATVEERSELLEAAVPIDADDPASRRFNLRRGPEDLELFDAKCTQVVDGEPEFHAHPTTHVPPVILRSFRDRGQISAAEYRRLVRRAA